MPIYGTRSKDQIISDWFGALRLKGESLYSLSGFGDGSHVRHFLENTSGGVFLLVVEKDALILKETFKRFDCSDILSHERFLLGTGVLMKIFKDMQEAVMQKLADVNSYIFPTIA